MANSIRAGRDTTDYQGASKFQQFGLGLALLFYVISIIMVNYTRFGIAAFDPNARSITIAHWQLEDGFREGVQDAIDSYVELHKGQGQNVRVVQNAIPSLTYPQWHLTQLVSGSPADIVEISCGSDMKNRYYNGLSPYIGDPNPYNAGTPLEGVPWKDTFFDDMNSVIDGTYADYYGVNLFAFTFRMYVNVDLLEAATGSRKLPEDVKEWLDDCRKVREYGVKHQKPIIPIGARGVDKGTIGQLFVYYNHQLTCDMNEFTTDTKGNQICINEFAGEGVGQFEQLKALDDGLIDLSRFTEPIDLVVEIGEYFSEGFTAIDLETTKYLFATGNVCFFAEGSWNAFSMVNNSPFAVEIMEVPVLVKKDSATGRIMRERHRFGNHFVGAPSEVGTGTGGQFGIPKNSKHFELALDFLRYLTSYNINQKAIVQSTKWLSALKKIDYSVKPGMSEQEAIDMTIMGKLKPMPGEGYNGLYNPILIGSYTRVGLGHIEEIIKAQQKGIINTDPGLFVYHKMQEKMRVELLLRDQTEGILGQRRTLWSNESLRTFFELGRLGTAIESELLKQAKAQAEQKVAAAADNEKKLTEAKAEQQEILKAIDKNIFNANRLQKQLLMSAENTVGHIAQMTTMVRFKKLYEDKYNGKPVQAIYHGKPVVFDTAKGE